MKQRIIDVATERFYKVGFHKVSLDQIVSELRTSKSSIYKYFDSKEDIVRELILSINKEINYKIGKIVDDNNLPFNKKIEEIISFTGNILSKVGEEFLRDLKIHTPDIWKEYLTLRKERLDKLYGKLIDDGIKNGILRSDIDKNFMLLVYTKLTEIAVQPDLLQEMSISNSDAYSYLSKIFLSGTLTKKGKRKNK